MCIITHLKDDTMKLKPRMGSVEDKIIEYLAYNPNQIIQAIQEGIEHKHYSPVNIAVHKLVDKKFLMEQKKSFKTKRGHVISTYSLGPIGVTYAIFEKGIAIDTDLMLRHYYTALPEARLLGRLFNIIDKYTPRLSRSRVKPIVGRVLYSLLDEGIYDQQTLSSVMGGVIAGVLMNAKLNKKQLKSLGDDLIKLLKCNDAKNLYGEDIVLAIEEVVRKIDAPSF